MHNSDQNVPSNLSPRRPRFGPNNPETTVRFSRRPDGSYRTTHLSTTNTGNTHHLSTTNTGNIQQVPEKK